MVRGGSFFCSLFVHLFVITQRLISFSCCIDVAMATASRRAPIQSAAHVFVRWWCVNVIVWNSIRSWLDLAVSMRCQWSTVLTCALYKILNVIIRSNVNNEAFWSRSALHVRAVYMYVLGAGIDQILSHKKCHFRFHDNFNFFAAAFRNKLHMKLWNQICHLASNLQQCKALTYKSLLLGVAP